MTKSMKIRTTLLIAMVLSVGLLLLNGCKESEQQTAETSSQSMTMESHEGHEHMAMESEPSAQTASVIEQKTCPVMGGAINEELFIEYKGKKVYFCCEGCEEKFKENPEQYIAKLPQFNQ